MLTPLPNIYILEIVGIRLLLEPFFAWVLIESQPNLMWILPGALELVIWLILNWQFITIDMDPAWSSRAHSATDSYLKVHQLWCEPSLEL